MKESAFYAWLYDRLPGMPTRIENAINSGLPDVALFYEGQTYWLELKVGSTALLRPVQNVVMRRMHNEGAKPMVWHLRGEIIHVHVPPFTVELKGKYMEIISNPCKLWHRTTCDMEEISSFLRRLSAV